MKKLIQGILEFRSKVLPRYRETFAKLAEGQNPDCLFIACSDSRVVPNLFASTHPGDLFVLRNIGNLVPAYPNLRATPKGSSVGAALEFAVKHLKVKDIIVCGHSDCGAMRALQQNPVPADCPHLQSWLELARPALNAPPLAPESPPLTPLNQLSQRNVLIQLDHLKSFPFIQDLVKNRKLKLHGWWFNISAAEVYFYSPAKKGFCILDESAAKPFLGE